MTGQLAIGGDGIDPGGPGTMNVRLGATVVVGLDTIIFPDSGLEITAGEFGTTEISFQGNGAFFWDSGTLHVGIFHGDLTTPNGGILAPGNSAGSTLILGNYTQKPSGIMQIEIGGTGQGTQSDFINVTGTALVDGTLELRTINGFVPAANQTFLVFGANSLLGIFDNAGNGQRVTTSDGRGSFVVHYGIGSSFDPKQIVLSDFVANALGDCDSDAHVDLTDYALFPNCMAGPAIASDSRFCGCMDINSNGEVDLKDFASVQRAFTGG